MLALQRSVCLSDLPLPQGSSAASCTAGFSYHLVTMESGLSPALGMVTWFTSAACLLSLPLSGEVLCAVDCFVLVCFLSVCLYTYFYIPVCGSTDTGMDFPAFTFPPAHRFIALGKLLSLQK